MQLRSPNRYNKRRRQSSAGTRWLFRLGFLLIIGLISYWIAQNPAEAENRLASVVDQINGEYQDKFGSDEATALLNVDAEYIACENEYLTGNYEEALQPCKAALTGRPNDVNLHFRLAHTLIITSDFSNNQERMNEAITIAYQAINANPESPLGWSILAMALDWSGNQPYALIAAERAQEIDPDFTFNKAVLANIYRNLALFEIAQTTIDEAVLDIQEGGFTDPFVIAQVYRNYGRLFVNLGNAEAAIEPYTLATKAMPDQTYIAIEFANFVYNGSGQYTESIELLETLRASHPHDASVLYPLALAYRRRGEIDKTIEVLTICVNTNADYLPCLSQLGYEYFWSDPPEYTLVIYNLENSTSLGSSDPYDWFMLARSYTKIQRCEDALKPLRQGYQLVQTTSTDFVTEEQFINAGRDCGIELQ